MNQILKFGLIQIEKLSFFFFQEVTTTPMRPDIDSYTPIIFTEDKPSKALDFSSDNDNSRLGLFRSDDNNNETRESVDDIGTARRRQKGNFTREFYFFILFIYLFFFFFSFSFPVLFL